MYVTVISGMQAKSIAVYTTILICMHSWSGAGGISVGSAPAVQAL